tara:strand:+ start:420 stop:1226 length:807 start_codon:yes stop_codon:yes gene_type:complete
MSHLITINRRPNSTNLPTEVYNESKRKLGSVFTAGGDIIRGLTFAEQKQYLPEILGVSPADPEFSRKCREYYLNLTVDVPMGGLDLEIGLDEDGHPLNVLDYIKYKFACAHPFVVQDESEITGSKRVQYYISDTRKELAEASANLVIRKDAYKEFIKISDNENRMNMVLHVYGANPKTMTKDEKELTLEELQEDNPIYFLDICKDKNLELTALINEALSAEALRRVGNSILDGDITLGNSMEEAVLFLKDKANSNVLTAVKAKLKAFA